LPLDDKRRLPVPKPLRWHGFGPFLSDWPLSFDATRGLPETPGIQRICSAAALRWLSATRMVRPP
jgi:hypothetical protein